MEKLQQEKEAKAMEKIQVRRALLRWGWREEGAGACWCAATAGRVGVTADLALGCWTPGRAPL